MSETIVAIFIALTAWSLGPCVLVLLVVALVVGGVFAWAYWSATLDWWRDRKKKRELYRRMMEGEQ